MKPFALNQGGKFVCLCAAVFLMILSSNEVLLAQQQISTFSVAGWNSGNNPIFSGSNTNVIDINYGDSITTSVAFSGAPNDGLGTDNDNVAYMSFSYTYTVYLTKFGEAFSVNSSLPIGSHTIAAFQTCSSGAVPPWTIGYDENPSADSNNITFNIADNIKDCIPAGDYQIDIVLDKYSVNSVGPSPSPIQLEWAGYVNNIHARGMTSLNAPSTDNNSDVLLSPSATYTLSQVAFVHVNQPSSCANLSLALPHTIETFAPVASATVAANYVGKCPENSCTYLWSNGERTATATDLHKGYTYTVTVTAPCGTTATASVTISNIMAPGIADIGAPSQHVAAPVRATTTNTGDRILKKDNGNNSGESMSVETHIALYPNPAKHNITFDLSTTSATAYSIRIFDMLGNEILAPTTGTSDAGSEKINIDLNDLIPGVYLYEVASDKTFRGKFVKQ